MRCCPSAVVQVAPPQAVSSEKHSGRGRPQDMRHGWICRGGAPTSSPRPVASTASVGATARCHWVGWDAGEACANEQG
eukprot:15435099-Alexandrium_andersonii.AAC.1